MNLTDLKDKINLTTKQSMVKVYNAIHVSAMFGDKTSKFSEDELNENMIKVLRLDGYTVNFNKFTKQYEVGGW